MNSNRPGRVKYYSRSGCNFNFKALLNTFVPVELLLIVMAKTKPVRPSESRPVPPANTRKSATAQPGPGGLWAIWIPAILLLVYFAYQPALQNDFVNWDDPTYVTENPLLLRPTPENKAALWSQPVSLNYHPLTMLSLAWNMDPAKPKARPFIATNIFLHVCNTALVFLFAYFLSRRKLLVAIFTALLFGIHPMHVESVAWVSERKDVLYTLFFMAALLSYLRYVRRGGWGWLAATLGLFVLSCLSKAMAVSLPLVLLLIDFYEGRLWQEGKIVWRAVLEKIPFLVISLLFGVKAVEIQSAGAIGDFQAFSLIQRIAIASYGFLFYLYKLFVPPPMVTTWGRGGALARLLAKLTAALGAARGRASRGASRAQPGASRAAGAARRACRAGPRRARATRGAPGCH
ncbi:MAG TPA: hypothetical protein PKL15_13015 [Saprospiraceae bacterium]|nr:hypothetical protein [Saprospiraceae bacterium]